MVTTISRWFPAAATVAVTAAMVHTPLLRGDENLGAMWGTAQEDAKYNPIVSIPIPAGVPMRPGNSEVLPDGRLAVETFRGALKTKFLSVTRGESKSPMPSPLLPTSISTQYNVRQWTPADGLPSSRIQCLLLTREGFLWIGTPQGLARFDGVRFRIFRGMDCRCLAQDKAGAVWIGTQSGLYCLRGREMERVPITPPPLSENGRIISAICARRAGGVWVNPGNHLAKGEGGTCENLTSRFPIVASQMIELSSGRVWIATPHGTLSWDPVSGNYENLSETLKLPEAARCFAEDVGGSRGLAGSGYADRFDPKNTQVRLKIPVSAPLAIEFAEDALWVGGDGGLWRAGTGEPERADVGGVTFGVVSTLLRHREGGLWVGTENDGLYLLAPKRVQMLTTKEGLAADDSWSVAEAPDGSVWVGTQAGVSHLSQGHCEKFGTSEGLPTPFANTVLADRAGRVWVGSQAVNNDYPGGISLLQNGRFVALGAQDGLPALDVTSFAPSSDGTLWITGSDRLIQWRDGRFRSFPQPALRAKLAFIDASNEVWVGGESLWRLRQEQFTHLSMDTGSETGIRAVVKQDENGAYWLVSQNKGVIRFKDGKFKVVTTENGLFSDLILSLLEDDAGRYWFNSHSGIFWVHKRNLNDVADGKERLVRCVHYGLEDGMFSVEGNGGNSPNSCKTRDGRLWVPTIAGVAIIDPQRVSADELPPTLVVEEMRAEGEVVFSDVPDFAEGTHQTFRRPTAISGTGETSSKGPLEIQLASGRGHALALSYTAPAFAAPEKIRFRYRLEGHDRDWIEAGPQRFAHFEELPPGHYRFQVKACSSHGVWSPDGASLSFFIVPQFYQRWSFFAACGIMLMGALGAFQSYRGRALKRIARSEQVAALGLQRERIARDLHDDLGGSLSRIALLSEVARGDLASTETLSRIDNIISISREVVDSIGELVWATNPKYDNLESVAGYFREYAAQLFGLLNITVDLDFPSGKLNRQVNADFRRQLFLVFKEALNNIAKHAGASKVEIKMEILPAEMSLTIRDYGVGMAVSSGIASRPSEVTSRHGLQNMRDRIAGLGGKCAIESSLGCGVTIRLTVPL